MAETLSELMKTATRHDEKFQEIDKRFDTLESKMDAGFDNIINKIDSFVGLYKGTVIEQAALKNSVNRHEQRISALEEKRLNSDHYYN